MGLATIDSRSQKEHTEIHKIPKFGVHQASFHCFHCFYVFVSRQLNSTNLKVMAASSSPVTIVANSSRLAKVAGAVAAIAAERWTFLRLTEGAGGTRNEMSICNETKHTIELEKWYIHWGKVKVPPEPYIESMRQDECLFHAASYFAPAGSSGIVTYRLQHETNLHIMWDCPFTFITSDNFIGLMLTSKKDRLLPSQDLFKNMYQYLQTMGISPKVGSNYDLVCCGPSHGGSKEAGGTGPWGHSRPCMVEDRHYKVSATMGDRHATCTKITISEVSK